MNSIRLDKKTKKKLVMPNVYVILFFIMIAAALATYLIPAGQFARVQDLATGREIIDPSSFHFIASTPTSFVDFFRSIPLGMREAVDIIFMVVLTMAGIEIIIQTGALNNAISSLMKVTKGKEYYMVILISIIFTAIGAFVGWAEGILMFIPIGVALSIALGFDAMVGFMMITATAGVGFAIGPTNIYTVGVAQGILGLPLFSGIGFRLAILPIFTIVTIAYILIYAKKIIAAGITIGLARSILVIIDNAQIIDTIIYSLANAIQILPTYLSAWGMYVVQTAINFFIPSGSGQAVVTVPILGPLSEMIGSTQQVAVLAYQLGDGFTNRLFPTSAALMAGLAMAGGIPYDRYVKHAGWLMLIWFCLLYTSDAADEEDSVALGGTRI